MSVRKLIIRAMLPLIWKTSRKRTANGLQRFSVTESDSAWQILYASEIVDDPELRAKLFHHALEEIYHATEFNRVSLAYSNVPMSSLLPERKPLCKLENGKEGLLDFIAYAHVGEKDVFDQFTSYSAAIGRCDAQSVFDNAKEDEKGHVELTMEILLNELRLEKLIKKKILKARFTRSYETWLRFSKVLGEIPSEIILSIIYYFSGIFLSYICRRRIARSYEIERLSSQ